MTAPAAAAPTAICSSYIGARRLRVTRLDRCGRPACGSERGYAVSGGFVSIEIGPEVEEGDDYTQKTAGGALCVSEKGQDNLKWFTVSIEFCQVDPDVFTIMNPTWKLVKNAEGLATGFRIGQEFSDQEGFALEMWPKTAGGAAICGTEDNPDEDPNFPVSPTGYFLLPWVLGTAPDSWTLENGTATFTLQGRTRVGSNWGRGPWAVTRDEHGQPTNLLVPIENGAGSSGVESPDGSYNPDMFHADQPTIAPPPEHCGAQPLTCPQCQVTVNGQTAEVQVTNYGTVVDPTGKIPVRVFWDDGSNYEEVPSSGTISHTYAQAGTYDIRVMAANSGAVCFKRISMLTVSSLALAPSTIDVPQGGDSAQITASATMSDGSKLDVTQKATWSIDPAVTGVSVSAGVVTAQSDVTQGTEATVKAEYQGKTASGTATVVAPALASGDTAGKAEAGPQKRAVNLTLDDAPAGQLTVDWGDGNEETVSGAGPHQHRYSRDGRYSITVTGPEGQQVTQQHVSVPFTTADPHDGK